MFINAKEVENRAVMDAAYAICAAARTAPKACGIDRLDTAILTGEDKDRVSAKLRELCGNDEKHFFFRDAGNVDSADVLVLIGAAGETRHLGKLCQLCGFEGCTACSKAGAVCAYNLIDLGIAIGSAVSIAADLRIDNRVMFSAGKAASELGLLGEYSTVMAIPLSVSGKSPFYDRESK